MADPDVHPPPLGPTCESIGALRTIGGRQRSPQGMRELDERWYGYGKGVMVDVDLGGDREAGGASGEHRVETVLEYESAEGTFGPGDPILFKSASVVGDRLYACTQTELLVYTFPGLELLHHASHPLLNDVHHVLPGDDGTMIAAVSGQDAVIELTLDGELVSAWAVDGSDLADRTDADRDYRHRCDLKPHAYHPNHLFRLDGDVWVTRFETRDAVKVGDATQRIAIDRERCHDGVVHDGRIYFTTVDGHVVEVDAATLERRAEHRLAGRRDNTLLGWCRGLTFVGDAAIVGFSRIRHTRVRGALSWVRNGLSASEPTRIAVYDPTDWSLLDEVDLEPAGCNAVFTIVPLPGQDSER